MGNFNKKKTRIKQSMRQMVESPTCLIRYSILGVKAKGIRKVSAKGRGALAKWNIIDDNNKNGKLRVCAGGCISDGLSTQ